MLVTSWHVPLKANPTLSRKEKLKIEESRKILDSLYVKKIQNTILGFDLTDLSIKRAGVKLNDCSTCTRPLAVMDCGLQNDNVALFWKMCEELPPQDSYCAGQGKIIIPDLMEPYRFCYDERAISSIEKAIRNSDSIKAIDRACGKVLEVCRKRIKHHKKVDSVFISRSFENMSRSALQHRSSMWHDINEGIRRLLIMPAQDWKNETQLEGSVSSYPNGFSIRSLHGHQLKRLQRQDRYNVTPEKPDLLTIGHYHLQMVLRKFDTWVLMTGHFLSYPTPRRIGFLSHLGSPICRITEPDEPHFKLLRARWVSIERNNIKDQT